MEDEQQDAQSLARKSIRRGLLMIGGMVIVGSIAAYVDRRSLIRHVIDRELTAYRIPATYTLRKVGPFTERLEAVRIGDRDRPDLTVRSIEIDLGYGVDGPYLEAVRANGVRLNASLSNGRVSFGALDTLWSRSKGSARTALPDVRVGITDTRIHVRTPGGDVGAAIDGQGNLADGFRGRIVAIAPKIDASGCAMRNISASLNLAVDGGRPHIEGPLSAAAILCPSNRLRLGAGRATIDVNGAETLDHWSGGLALAGFAGGRPDTQISGLSGLLTVRGGATAVQGNAAVTLDGVQAAVGRAGKAVLGGRFSYVPSGSALVFLGDATIASLALAPDLVTRMQRSARLVAGSPLDPLAQKLTRAVAGVAGDADVDAKLAITIGGPQGSSLTLHQLRLRGRDGGFVHIDEGQGIGWQAAQNGWRFDGRVSTGGQGLPAVDLLVSQATPQQSVRGTFRLARYSAGDATISIPALQVALSSRTARFGGTVTLSGPVGRGRVDNLTIPLSGQIDRTGQYKLNQGCFPLGFDALRLGSVSIRAGRVRICGQRGEGLISNQGFGAEATGVHLTGLSGLSPLDLHLGGAQISSEGVTLTDVALSVGPPDASTRMDAKSVKGHVLSHGAAGTADGVDASIAHVPLLLTNLSGPWNFDRNSLSLEGNALVADASDPVRFLPLAVNAIALRVSDGHIDAKASLSEPKSQSNVAQVTINHDLPSGTGNAVFAVPALTFAPKGLQPEALTPLTLGVIANVAGTLTGGGQIAWTPQGVRSLGSFRTEGLNLAAAFGPVTSIAGVITFSDLLGLVTPPGQEARIAEINPGVAVSNGVVHFSLPGRERVDIEDARWPFAGGTLSLEPSRLSFEQTAQRHLTFRLDGLDAASFVQQLAFPNISATGTFDGVLPMIFDQSGGRIVGGEIIARKGGGTLAYVGELSTAQIGEMGKLAFDALKAIRYQSLAINLDGRLDGEIISRVRFDGLRQSTGDRSLVARMISNLPFRFNIQIKAPFRGLLGSARAFVDPSTLLDSAGRPITTPPGGLAPDAIQPSDSESVR